MTFTELLPAYDFCKGKGLDAEADKIKQLINIYVDLACEEHKAALDRLKLTSKNGPVDGKETKE